MITLEDILEQLDGTDALLMEPRSDYDQAIIGIGARFNDFPIVVYDTNRVLEILKNNGMESGLSEDEAWQDAEEWFEFNMIGSWMGPGTPMFISEMRSDLNKGQG